MGKYKDISGQKFGRLTALEIDVEKTKTHSSTYWKCQCDCGNIKSISLKRLRNGALNPAVVIGKKQQVIILKKIQQVKNLEFNCY